jgi:hypothetical protein
MIFLRQDWSRRLAGPGSNVYTCYYYMSQSDVGKSDDIKSVNNIFGNPVSA